MLLMLNINLVHLDGIIVLNDYIKSLNIFNKIENEVCALSFSSVSMIFFI